MTDESGRTLLDGPAIALALGVHPVTVRRWATRGWITRRGTATRRAMYDLEEVTVLAEALARDDVIPTTR